MIRHYWTANGEGFWLTDPFEDNPTEVFIRLLNDGVEGLGNPPHSSFTRSTALLDGQSTSGWKAEPREVFWPILIDADESTWDDVQSRFWSTMRPNLYGVWTVFKEDTSSRYLNVRYLTDGGAQYKVDPSRTGAETHGLTLIADDPWWHTETVSAVFQTAETPIDFFNGGTAPDFYIMSGNTVDSVTLENPGDVPSWATYRIDGPATSFDIETVNIDELGFPTNGGSIAGDITLLAGEWLIIDTNPTQQTAFLYTSPSNYTDVTSQLDEYSPRPIETGLSTEFSVTLFGEGSLTVSLIPSYYRAF